MLFKVQIVFLLLHYLILLLLLIWVHNLQEIALYLVLILLTPLLCSVVCGLFILPLLLVQHHVVQFVVHPQRGHVVKLEQTGVHPDRIVAACLHDCLVYFRTFYFRSVLKDGRVAVYTEINYFSSLLQSYLSVILLPFKPRLIHELN